MGLFACINTLETVSLKVVPLGFASTWLSFPSFEAIFRLSSEILTSFQSFEVLTASLVARFQFPFSPLSVS
jgi:hypothetical protein